jgi:IS30 family transposase
MFRLHPNRNYCLLSGGGLKESTQHFILDGKMEWMSMDRRYAPGFNAVEKEELWDRWRRGESLKAIGRAFGKPSSSIYFQVAPHGGIRPAPRRRSRLALTLLEREEISRGIAAARSTRSMARLLGHSPSTVSREIKRNGGYDCYRAALADEQAWVRARRPKRCKLANNPQLRQAVVRKLRLNWSPEQIAGWLKRTYPEDESCRVSHETIYRSLYVQARGVLKKELLRHLRSKRTMRRPRRAGDKRGQIADLVSISKRPAAVEDRAVPGHWEGDLLSGSKNSYIATLVERHTRYVTLAKVANKDTQTVVSALIKQARTMPNELYKSLTWDRGKELADHRQFTLATNIDVYFCDPQSPWQRGSNENTNGLLRQYFPKGTDLSVYSQKQLNKVARQLNERPRKTLGFETPAERFNACVASTA